MLRFAADENFNNDILRGLQRRRADLDVVRVQDAGLSGAPDPEVLEWAAREGRLLLTHDAATMTAFAYERAARQQPMPGVIEVQRKVPLGQVIEDILLIAECGFAEEWEGQVRYLPL